MLWFPYYESPTRLNAPVVPDPAVYDRQVAQIGKQKAR
jgi:hypothetical protein